MKEKSKENYIKNYILFSYVQNYYQIKMKDKIIKKIFPDFIS